MTKQELIEAVKRIKVGKSDTFDYRNVNFENFQALIDELEAARGDGAKVKLDRPADKLRVTVEPA